MYRVLSSIAVLLLLSACANHSRSDQLQSTLRAYHSAVRWDGFTAAWQFVEPAYREAHPLSSLDEARFSQVRVVSYDEGRGAVKGDDDVVHQVARIGLVNRHTQRERFVVDEQTWEWDSKAKRWWLMNGLPDITSH